MTRPADLPKFDELGKRIAYWREKRGLTRRELARRAKVKYSTLSGIEDGSQKRSTQIPEIAQALGLNPIYLATDKGDPESGAPPEIAQLWPFTFPASELLDLDPIELELAGMKLQRIIEEIRTKRPKIRTRRTGESGVARDRPRRKAATLAAFCWWTVTGYR